MKGAKIKWSARELAWIKANATKPRAHALAEFHEKFGRPEVSMSNYSALCKRKGWLTGRTGKFEKGQKSWNEGKAHPASGASIKTQFKPGVVPKNIKPMGTERIGKFGYIEIKVPRVNPHTGHSTRYMHKHRWNWEQANGPLPVGMALKCLDGNRQNCEPSNWISVPRALLPRLAGGRWGRISYDNAPADIRPALLAIAKLEHAAREKRKGKA